MIGLGLGALYIFAAEDTGPIHGAYGWVVDGTLYFSAPASEAWAAAADWILMGVLDFSAPIAQGNWSTPEGTPYTTLVFEEPTQ